MKMSNSFQRRIAACLLVQLCGLSLTQARPAPQFEVLETGMLLAAGQVKEMMDAGGAAQNQQSVDFLGAKMNMNTALGFGDAIKGAMGPQGRRRRRRRRRQADDASVSYESSAEYSNADDEYDESDNDESDMDA